MIKLVLASEPDHVGEWIYPGTWPDLATPPADALETDLLGPGAFSALWRILDPDAPHEEALQEVMLPAAGYPHRGPGRFDEVNPALLERLLAVPAHERWRTADAWATALAGRAPNKERASAFKRLLQQVCDLAARRGQHMLVLLPR